MIQLTRKGVSFTGAQEDLKSLREKFETDDYVILPRLYEPFLFEEILQRVNAAPFLPRKHEGISLEFCMQDEVTNAMLAFFPNNPVFLRIVEQITGQAGIGQFVGRVYQMTASDGHFDHWHDDFVEDRLVAMSMNLTRGVYSGGALQMRYYDSEEIHREIHNTGFGDALLFRISEKLAHRVQGVTGDNPKTAFAGWFLKGEDFLRNLRGFTQRFSGKCAEEEAAPQPPVSVRKG